MFWLAQYLFISGLAALSGANLDRLSEDMINSMGDADERDDLEALLAASWQPSILPEHTNRCTHSIDRGAISKGSDDPSRSKVASHRGR